jgi:hypothetical protein
VDELKQGKQAKPVYVAIRFGEYEVWDLDADTFGITCDDVEGRIFSKDEFKAHIAAFFELNF